jgi:hypothetical protein
LNLFNNVNYFIPFRLCSIVLSPTMKNDEALNFPPRSPLNEEEKYPRHSKLSMKL